jgi:hypothetical protein
MDKKIIKSIDESLKDTQRYSDVLRRELEDSGISTTDPKNQEDATEFAKLLFVLWVGDNFIDSKSFVHFYEKYKNESDLIQTKFIEKYLVYLCVGVAIVLINEHGKETDKKIKQHIKDTLVEFENIVWRVMDIMFGLSQNDVDKAMANAGQDYPKLLNNNPNEHPAFSLTWAREWFKQVGIEETNQIVLFEFGHSWMNDFIYLSKVVSEILARK